MKKVLFNGKVYVEKGVYARKLPSMHIHTKAPTANLWKM